MAYYKGGSFSSRVPSALPSEGLLEEDLHNCHKPTLEAAITNELSWGL